MDDVKFSNKLFLILNENNTIFENKHREHNIYRTAEKLMEYQKDLSKKKIAVFELKEIIDAEEIDNYRS